MINLKYKTMYDALGRESVHPFPARMAPSIALKLVGKQRRRLRVLDPMMGSGTVLALAQANGHHAVGVDIDPLAVLISKVWTRPINKQKAKAESIRVFKRAQNIFLTLDSKSAFPNDADDETKKFITFWFDFQARKQLCALTKSIREVRSQKIRDVLWCSISRLIIAKKMGVSLAMDLSHSRPHKVFKTSPIKPFDKFLSSSERVINSCLEDGQSSGGIPKISIGDARKLAVKNGSIDLVLTSPPYLNAIDYMRCSKFSLVWMGYQINMLRGIRTESIGSELRSSDASGDKDVQIILDKLKLRSQLTLRNEAIMARYIFDMKKMAKEVARVLVRKGRAVYVVGENMIQGTFIRNSLLMKEVAEQVGLSYLGQRVRILPTNRRYLPPPSVTSSGPALQTRMRREVVMTFIKVK